MRVSEPRRVCLVVGWYALVNISMRAGVTRGICRYGRDDH
jgi:hypothetical protein